LSDRYSDPDLAHRHLEQVTHAFLLSSARDAGPLPALDARFRAAADALADAAGSESRALLTSDGLLAFFHQVTPIEEIARLDAGLAALRERDEDIAAEMYREWPFFRAMLDFAQMSLAKADMGVFTAYLELVDAPLRARFGTWIEREHAAAVREIERAAGAAL